MESARNTLRFDKLRLACVIMQLMTYDILFAGLGGTLIGVWFTCRLTYAFQQRLLNQQLAFQKELFDSQLAFQKESVTNDAELRRKIYDDWQTLFTEFRNMVNERMKRKLTDEK
jgi:hypothetical protein